MFLSGVCSVRSCLWLGCTGERVSVDIDICDLLCVMIVVFCFVSGDRSVLLCVW